MIDFAWSEFFVVIVVAVLVIGPKQLPEVLHGIGRVVRRLQYMKFALSKQFDDFMEESDLRELRDVAPPRLVSPDMLDEAAHDMEFMTEIPPLAEVQAEALPAKPKKDKKTNSDQGDLLGLD